MCQCSVGGGGGGGAIAVFYGNSSFANFLDGAYMLYLSTDISLTGWGRLGCVCLLSILYKICLVTQNVYQILVPV